LASHDQEQTSKKYDSPAKSAGGTDSRDQEQTPHVYEFGDFRLNTRDASKYRLLRNGQPYKIQDMPFCLLCALVENYGRELSKEELIGRLWPGAVVDSYNRESYAGRLHQHVKKLRTTVGWEMVAHRKGAGAYFFTPEVKVIMMPEPPPDVVPDFQFQQWIVRSDECRGIKLFMAAGVALSLFYSAVYLLGEYTGFTLFAGHNTTEVLSLMQLVVVIGGLFASLAVLDQNVKEFPAHPLADAELMRISGYTDREKWGRAKEGAASSKRMFSRYWKLLLVAWVCLYLLLFLIAYFKEHGGSSNLTAWLSISSTVFNNFNSWAIALCFTVLNHPTVFMAKPQGAGRAPQDGADAADEQEAGTDQEPDLVRLTRRITGWGGAGGSVISDGRVPARIRAGLAMVPRMEARKYYLVC
jgi:hypothetical protein